METFLKKMSLKCDNIFYLFLDEFFSIWKSDLIDELVNLTYICI